MTIDFKKSAREILHDHPEISGTTLFIDPAANETVGTPLARLRGRLSGTFRTQVKAAEEAAAGNAAPLSRVIRNRRVNGVLVTPGRQADEEALFELYRQAGRIVVPLPRGAVGGEYFANLFGVPQAAENSIADTYAVLRTLNRKDGNGDFIDGLAVARAEEFMRTGDPHLLTTFAIDRVLADKTSAALAPKDMPAAVQKYVEETTPSREASDLLVKEFAPLKGRVLDDAGLKLLSAITAATENPLAATLGRRVLAARLPDFAPAPAPETKIETPTPSTITTPKGDRI